MDRGPPGKNTQDQNLRTKSGGRGHKPLVGVLVAMAALLVHADPGELAGLIPGAQPQAYEFSRTQVSRCVHTYKSFMRNNKYIKKHEVIRTKGQQAHMDIITANITYLSDAARAWLCEQTADIILVQEHRMLTRGEFGKIPGYDVIFSPARRTVCSDRGWEAPGGVAILYRTQNISSGKG